MRPPESWSRARVTLGIILATAAAWIFVSVLGLDGRAAIWGGFIPARAGLSGEAPFAPFWLTPLTATFVHANLIHVGFNLLILAYCGRPTENVLGPVGLGALYLVGAYAAAAAQYLAGPDSITPMIGASGAVSAVIGAYAVLFGRNKVKVRNPTAALWLNALWLMAAWVVLQLVIGLAFSAAGSVQLAVAAHIGGFLAGVLLANPLLLIRYRKA
jgi:membrane associated rhomboid family serine protease